MTKLTPVPANPSPRVDWRPVVATLRADPGQWYRVEDEIGKPSTSLIRRGMPRAFEPAGSFDARRRDGRLELVFLGEPVKPWEPHLGDDRPFDEVERRAVEE